MIHVNCYMIDIMWYVMSVLAGPRLMISACVENSEVSTSLVRDWDEGQLVLEGGMVPDYINLFLPMFYRSFYVCIYGIITCFYAYAF